MTNKFPQHFYAHDLESDDTVNRHDDGFHKEIDNLFSNNKNESIMPDEVSKKRSRVLDRAGKKYIK